jgi:hypothetical protein
MSGNIPCTKKPCKGCPFRKDSLKGWLGRDRAKEVSEASSFVCHNNTGLQCAGNMLLNKEANTFYRIMKFKKLENILKGEDLIFKTHEEMINHHDLKNI